MYKISSDDIIQLVTIDYSEKALLAEGGINWTSIDELATEYAEDLLMAQYGMQQTELQLLRDLEVQDQDAVKTTAQYFINSNKNRGYALRAQAMQLGSTYFASISDFKELSKDPLERGNQLVAALAIGRCMQAVWQYASHYKETHLTTSDPESGPPKEQSVEQIKTEKAVLNTLWMCADQAGEYAGKIETETFFKVMRARIHRTRHLSEAELTACTTVLENPSPMPPRGRKPSKTRFGPIH